MSGLEQEKTAVLGPCNCSFFFSFSLSIVNSFRYYSRDSVCVCDNTFFLLFSSSFSKMSLILPKSGIGISRFSASSSCLMIINTCSSEVAKQKEIVRELS